MRICCCQNSSQVLPSSCGKQGDELRFQGTVLWSSSVLAGVRFCLKTELLLFPGVMSNTQERAGCDVGLTTLATASHTILPARALGDFVLKSLTKPSLQRFE